MRRIVKWLGEKLIRRVTRRAPDVIIGGVDDPYMLRWWIIPRNKVFNLYLHKFMRSDDDRALHDHPWWNVSVLLNGTYSEVTPIAAGLAEILRMGEAAHIANGGAPFSERAFQQHTTRRAGDVVFRQATAAHRIKLLEDDKGKPRPVWSFFITGPLRRKWGFYCPQGWRPWDVFVQNTTDENGQITSKVGRGCD